MLTKKGEILDINRKMKDAELDNDFNKIVGLNF